MNWQSENHRWEVYEDNDLTGSIGDSLLSNNLENKMLKLDSSNIQSALVYVVLTAVLGLLMYVIGVGDVYAVDFHSIVNIFAISVMTGIVSLIKNL